MRRVTLKKIILFISINTLFVSAYAADSYVNTEAGYSVELSKFDGSKERITNTDTITMAADITAYLIESTTEEYKTEYLVIGPMGVKGEVADDILEVVSSTLDGQEVIIGK